MKIQKMQELCSYFLKLASFGDQIFSDNFGEWKIKDILLYVKDNVKTEYLDVEELAKIAFQPSPEEEPEDIPGSPEFVERAAKSNIKYPIIVIRYNDGDFVADGNHRLWKAKSLGMKKIKGYLITDKILHTLPKAN